MGWPCTCCGYRTLPGPPVGTLEVCPVCGWRDLGPYDWGRGPWSWNTVDLSEARAAFDASGCCEPALADLVRDPRPDEARPAWWGTPRAQRGALVRAFEEAFRWVRLAGGISLREANDIDDYAAPPRTEAGAAPDRYPEPPPWEALEESDLAECAWGPFVFMDALGLRYYLPALARFELRHGRDPNNMGSLMFALGRRVGPCRALFTPDQRRVTAEWLFHHTRDDRSWLARWAPDTLRAGWEADLDDERRAMIP